MNLEAMPSHDVILYAKWSKGLKVTFNPVGGYTSKDYVYIASGKAIGDLPVATKEGHTFDGWYTDETGGSVISEKTVFPVGDDTTVYAHWTVNTYAVVFNTNGGTGLASISFVFGAVITVPTGVEKEGFVFDGWYLDQDFLYAMNLTKMPARDITLFAKWREVADGDEKDALDIIDIVFGSLLGGAAVIFGAVYTIMACFCSVCSSNAKCAKYNLFTKCKCGRAFLEKMRSDAGVELTSALLTSESSGSPTPSGSPPPSGSPVPSASSNSTAQSTATPGSP